MTKKTVYDIVKERFVDALKEGTIPWRQTWKFGAPRNILTKKPYRGINILLLGSHPWWGTYNQIKKLGGQVRKGEKASGIVIYWSWDERKKVTDPTTGEEKTVIARREYPLVRYYAVFNLDQVDGIESPDPVTENERHVSCDAILKKHNPTVARGNPAYSPGMDVITMPKIKEFVSSEMYYAAFFHELTHWTGHESRLNREGITKAIQFGSDRYAREELVAEMGAAFLCAITGIDAPVLENQKAYVKGWLEKVENSSPKDLIKSASEAQKAADFLTKDLVIEDPKPVAVVA
jgi:antirestriction protein ArdC